MHKNRLPYCGELIRKHDPDMFLISMFSKADSRESIWALFAFNYEISKTRFVVSDTALGLIRLQWWRDAIGVIYDKGEYANHEVLKSLAKTIKKHKLPREYFDKLIYAHEFDLEGVSPANLEGLMNYAEFTIEPLLYLSLMVLGEDPALEVLQPIAINFTLARLLRATADYFQNDCFLLPDDLMCKYEVTKDNIYTEAGRVGLTKVVKEIIDNKLPASNCSCDFINVFSVLGDIYFKQVISLNYDVMSPKLKYSPAFKVLKLFWRIKIM